jgi:hypothetical protein
MGSAVGHGVQGGGTVIRIADETEATAQAVSMLRGAVLAECSSGNTTAGVLAT